MTANPWSKFYWNDWDRDAGLRLCSFAAQGLWMRLLCMAGRSDGKVLLNGEPPTADQLGRLYGENPENISAWLKELENNFVFSKNKNGIIFSRRMIKDQKKIKIARENGKSGGNPSLGKQKQTPPLVNPPDNPPLKQAPSGISTLPLNPLNHLTTEPHKKETISNEIVVPPPGENSADENSDLQLPEFLDRRPKRQSTRGCRIPDDWLPDEKFAAEQGLGKHAIDLEAEKFRNYWGARAGPGAVKIDWGKTWRNWILKKCEDENNGGKPGGFNSRTPASIRPRVGGFGAFADLAAEAAGAESGDIWDAEPG